MLLQVRRAAISLGCNFSSPPGPSKAYSDTPHTDCRSMQAEHRNERETCRMLFKCRVPWPDWQETISRNLWVAGHALVLAALLGFMSDAETTQEIVPSRPIVQDSTLSPRARAHGEEKRAVRQSSCPNTRISGSRPEKLPHEKCDFAMLSPASFGGSTTLSVTGNSQVVSGDHANL
jgi:hypothetical protein